MRSRVNLGSVKKKKSCLSTLRRTPISRSFNRSSSHNTDWAMSVVRWGGNDIMVFNTGSWNSRNSPTSLTAVNYVHCEKNILRQRDMFSCFSIFTAVSYWSSWTGIWNCVGRYSVNICWSEARYETKLSTGLSYEGPPYYSHAAPREQHNRR